MAFLMISCYLIEITPMNEIHMAKLIGKAKVKPEKAREGPWSFEHLLDDYEDGVKDPVNLLTVKL